VLQVLGEGLADESTNGTMGVLRVEATKEILLIDQTLET